MNNKLQMGLSVTLVLLLAIGLFLGGMFFNQMLGWMWYRFMPGWMMGNDGRGWGQGFGGGWMMRNSWHRGMMNGAGFRSPTNVEPLSIGEAEQAVREYLSYFGQQNLALKEIMVFDNHAYAIVVEKDSGIGAFELLIDPVDKDAYPEYGPNMMWNLKYGMHSGGGMMGGWWRGNQPPEQIPAEMPIDEQEAMQIAQQYLSRTYPGVTVSEEITPFYGYYTIDVEKDGQMVGMLSVNGYDGRVFYHFWHGTFIKMSEAE